MEFVKVDGQGRIYLSKAVREAAGIKGGAVLEVTAVEGKIVLSKREESIAESGRGVFKLRRRIGDVDEEIRKRSVQVGLGELNEIRGC